MVGRVLAKKKKGPNPDLACVDALLHFSTIVSEKVTITTHISMAIYEVITGCHSSKFKGFES